MLSPANLLFLLIAVALVPILLITLRPAITESREGKILAFVALVVLPTVAAAFGASEHMERSKRTEFCLSCHVMADYGRSLHVNDSSYLAAAHFLNNRVPREEACYTCHTDYVMYGTIRAKLRGLRHVWAQYVGTPAQPIKLYRVYNNRECLHCHEGSKSFVEGAVHNADPETLPAIRANKLSCLSSGCHEIVHNVKELDKVKFWSPPQ